LQNRIMWKSATSITTESQRCSRIEITERLRFAQSADPMILRKSSAMRSARIARYGELALWMRGRRHFVKDKKSTPEGVPISKQDYGITPRIESHGIRIRPLKDLCEKWQEFDENYVVGDDGHIYRRLKENYYRDRKYGYKQVRNSFGTGKQHTIRVHDAVGKGFLDNPNGFTDVDHINNIKSDNRAVNLQYMSHKDNLLKKKTDAEIGGK